ncbi:MAG: metal-dependent hydrolase [Pseudomonadota bacterium]
MDPISQGAIGAAAAQSGSGSEQRRKLLTVTWLGCLAGLAPDLDILIQSPTDPLLFLEFHRHFTHALVFIPFGALLVSVGTFWLARRTLSFRETYLACLLGYATHALLDACTSYGTQLFWPFSNMRIAWNNVSVVDPLFTLPLLTCVLTAAFTNKRRWALLGIVWACVYLSFGVVQMQRATSAAMELASQRGHSGARLTVKPSFGNLLLWKSIYADGDNYYVDAIRAMPEVQVCPGERIEKLSLAKHLSALDTDSQQARDLERFRWFSNDYLALFNTNAGPQVIDIRYSMVPNQVDPMWGIFIDTEAPADQHVRWDSNRNLNATKRQQFNALLAGDGCGPLWQYDG